MPTFDIPQDVIDEWMYDATQEDDDDDVSYDAGYKDGVKWAARIMLSQLGIKVPI